MKYCAKCGAEILENNKFCEVCGNEVNMDSAGNAGKRIKLKKTVAVIVVAAVIAVAGYLQYTAGKRDSNLAKEAGTDISEDTHKVSGEDIYSAEDIFTEPEASEENTADVQPGEEITKVNGQSSEDVENSGDAVLTSTNEDSIDFVAEVKLNREQIRSQNKASLLEIINNAGIGEEQKQDAINAMIAMTDIAEREAAAEMLLEAKGFTDVVVYIVDGNADVVLNMGEITDAKRAQVEDIVKRKTNIAAENIVITPIQNDNFPESQ